MVAFIAVISNIHTYFGVITLDSCMNKRSNVYQLVHSTTTCTVQYVCADWLCMVSLYSPLQLRKLVRRLMEGSQSPHKPMR